MSVTLRNRPQSFLSAALTRSGAALLWVIAAALVVHDHRANGAERQGRDWLSIDRTDSESHFSPLSRINDRNVSQLGLAWYLDLPGEQTLEATPLEVNGVLYFSGTNGKTYAVDARMGRQIWKFAPDFEHYRPRILRFMMGAHRGVAYWDGEIYVGVVDGRLFALNAKTGNLVWSVQTFGDSDRPKVITGAPRIFKGKVIIGHSTGELGGRGYVTAYDAKNGKQLWRFFTVPGDPQKGFENEAMARAARTWGGEWWKIGGGGPVWNAITYDPDFDRIYLGVGNGNPVDATARGTPLGDNLFLCSIVALDANTGKYVWHYQETPADSWDYDASEQMVLAELSIAGKRRKVLMQASKNGFFYVIDRVSGKLISAQNFSKVTWASGVNVRSGRPVENPDARGLTRPALVWPSAQGAHTFQAMSFDQETGLVYIPAIKLAMRMEAGDIGELVKVDADDATGGLLAWDPVLQRSRWVVQHDTLWNGGILSTAGNLVFQGTGGGQFNAYSASTGAKLWTFYAGLGIIAAPMAYDLDGTQYVSVLVGYGGSASAAGKYYDYGWRFGEQPRRLLTFALGKHTALPPGRPPRFAVAAVDDPSVLIDPKEVEVGAALYRSNCALCHGPDLRSSGPNAPDLRESKLALNWGAFRSLLKGGWLANAGMPKFDDLRDEDLHELFTYVRSGAREAIARPNAE